MASSLLPNQIPPPGHTLTESDGRPTKNWYLFLYNLAQNVLNPYSGGVSEQSVVVERVFARRF